MPSFSGASALHVRIVVGDIVKAIAPNDGTPLPYAEGAPLTLHLPPEALRVLAPS